MKIIQRAYSGEADRRGMAALAQAFPADNFHVNDLPYRFSSWAFDDPENICLWFDAQNQLTAWAVLQTPWWTIDYAYHPALGENLYPQILAWADERAQKIAGTPNGRPAWYINVFTEQVDRIRDLEEAGFASQANVSVDPSSKVYMCCSTQTPLKAYAPPAGFVVRSLAGEDEVEAYVALHRAVFESKNMTVEWRRRTLQHPDYRADLDVVVAAPDGRLVAFCICWFNSHSGSEPLGQIEPLGCHKDFRRYALGRVALAEGLRRLKACGVQSIYVETDSYRNTAFALYEAMGFKVVKDVLVFRKDYGV